MMIIIIIFSMRKMVIKYHSSVLGGENIAVLWEFTITYDLLWKPYCLLHLINYSKLVRNQVSSMADRELPLPISKLMIRKAIELARKKCLTTVRKLKPETKCSEPITSSISNTNEDNYWISKTEYFHLSEEHEKSNAICLIKRIIFFKQSTADLSDCIYYRML